MKYISFLIVIASVLLLIGCEGNQSTNDVRRRLDTEIPVGTAKKDVLNFLRDNSFDFEDDPNMTTWEHGEKFKWTVASVEKQSLFGKNKIVIYMFFDVNDETLKEYSVKAVDSEWIKPI